jgi:hypothetical protein
VCVCVCVCVCSNVRGWKRMSEGEEKWTRICGERNMKPWHGESVNEVDLAAEHSSTNIIRPSLDKAAASNLLCQFTRTDHATRHCTLPVRAIRWLQGTGNCVLKYMSVGFVIALLNSLWSSVLTSCPIFRGRSTGFVRSPCCLRATLTT